jgi:hypothetical protein
MVRPSEKLERRTKARFPIHRELRYKVLEDNKIVASGVGTTVDISSSGLGFDIDQTVKPGSFIELSISWPVLLDESCPMRLIVFGRVLRTGFPKTVCTIDKHEFRTQARTLQAVPARSDAMLQRWADGYRREILKAREVAV